MLTFISNRPGPEVSHFEVAFLSHVIGKRSFGTALVSRFFLGFSEAVYYPGILLLISRW